MKYRRCQFAWKIIQPGTEETVWLNGRFYGFGVQNGNTICLVENEHGEMLMRKLNQVQFPQWDGKEKRKSQ